MSDYAKRGISTDVSEVGASFIRSATNVNESELLGECTRGNPCALRYVIEHYTKPIQIGARKALEHYPHNHCHELYDLVQDVIVRILESPKKRLSCKHGEIRDLKSWLCTLSLNLSLNKLESANRSQCKVEKDFGRETLGRPTAVSIDYSTQLLCMLSNLSDPSLCIVDSLTACTPPNRHNALCNVARRFRISMRQVRRKVAIIKKRILRGEFSQFNSKQYRQ